MKHMIDFGLKGANDIVNGLTFYGILTDLAKMKNDHEQLKTDLIKLERTYSTLKSDERFQRIKGRITATLSDYAAIIAKYDGMNRAAEEEASKPLDYAEACRHVLDTDLQASCQHPTDSWRRVMNVPRELRQYQDDTDWLCGLCGKLVLPF